MKSSSKMGFLAHVGVDQRSSRGLGLQLSFPKSAIMLVAERIRELCLRVTEAEGEDFQIALLELSNALELYELTQETNGHKTAHSPHN